MDVFYKPENKWKENCAFCSAYIANDKKHVCREYESKKEWIEKHFGFKV